MLRCPQASDAGHAGNTDQCSAFAADHRIDKCVKRRSHGENIRIKDLVKNVQVFTILSFHADRDAGTGDRDIRSAALLIKFAGFLDQFISVGHVTDDSRVEFRMRKRGDQFIEFILSASD